MNAPHMKFLLQPSFYLPILNGFIGDKLAVKKDSWTIRMAFRVNGEDVEVKDLDKKHIGKNAIVFVHGLMADEKIWKHFLKIEKDLSVFYVRYNTGLHISENGRELARLLEELQTRMKIKKLFLAGHSMGGLVIRSACYYGQKEKYNWVDHVRSVFLIAVPNAGAALEKISHFTSGILSRFARWHFGLIGNILEQRSNGIKDLRLGFMIDEDWKNPVGGARLSVPPLPKADYHILIGHLSGNEKSLIAQYFGDGLVTHKSAVGVTLFKVSNIHVFPRTGHNSILASPKLFKYVKKGVS